jgi:hypothetical protein
MRKETLIKLCLAPVMTVRARYMGCKVLEAHIPNLHMGVAASSPNRFTLLERVSSTRCIGSCRPQLRKKCMGRFLLALPGFEPCSLSHPVSSLLSICVSNPQNCWVSALYPSSGILSTRKHNFSETGRVSALR